MARPLVSLLFLALVLAPARLLPQAPEAPLGADLLVAPSRLVFEGHRRSGELNLSNPGPVPVTYRISLIRMDMDEEGGFRELPLAPDQREVTALFRFSPREVTLGPQETQTVRVQVRKPPELPPGEYRLHMAFRAVPPPEPVDAPSSRGLKGVSIRLRPLCGIAIPLILRHGDTRAQVAIGAAALDPATGRLEFRLERSGSQSVYGDLLVSLLRKSGPPSVLAMAAGIAVYAGNPLRRVRLDLPPGTVLPPGSRLRIAYALPAQDGGGPLAESTLTVP